MSTPNPRVTPRRDAEDPTRSRPEASRADVRPPRPVTSPAAPEWTEQQWKRQVEAEARSRLKKNLAVLRSDK